MKAVVRALFLVLVLFFFLGTQEAVATASKFIEDRLEKMSDDQLVGQLTLQSAGLDNTGPTLFRKEELLQGIKEGRIGSLFNAFTVDFTTKMQKLALENGQEPLAFMFDVIHGYRTIFPIPLGEAASWDIKGIEKSARLMSEEASAGGLHLTFAPMIDISRDPRWGRMAESGGEDPFLVSLMAHAKVRGIQGSAGALLATNELMACGKHYVGYGAAEGGKDYATSQIAEDDLRNVFLRPFKAAVDAGVSAIMPGFNSWKGLPCTASPYLLQDILRGELKFQGLILTDYTAIPELISHGLAANRSEAAELAKRAGVDVDMEGLTFASELKRSMARDKSIRETVKQSVRRVLEMKERLGLYQDPYRYSNAEREKAVVLSPVIREHARDIGRKSIVLLKNGDPKSLAQPPLPLSRNISRIALIGPLGMDRDTVLGSWRGFGDPKHAVSLYEGLRAYAPHAKIDVIRGAGIEREDQSKEEFTRAVEVAKRADVVIAAMGESAGKSGEAASKSDLELPGVQGDLLKLLWDTGTPVVLVLMNGRPLAIPWAETHLDAIMETWHLGTETGHAIADVLFGAYNPSGKLPVSFPRTVGQEPTVYYNHMASGRPPVNPNNRYESKYIDVENNALYPFGFGLSYAHFQYDNLKVETKDRGKGKEALISVQIKNVGRYGGKETVQLYIRDVAASRIRPVKELKGFETIPLAPDESRTVEFKLSPKDLTFFKEEKGLWKEVFEPGEFKVMVGTDSEHGLTGSFVF